MKSENKSRIFKCKWCGSVKMFFISSNMSLVVLGCDECGKVSYYVRNE